MPKVCTFTVVPKLPSKLTRLLEIANNLCWCWDPEAIELFFRVDRVTWEESKQNPVRVLGHATQERFEELAGDEGFLAQLDRVYDRLQQYLK